MYRKSEKELSAAEIKQIICTTLTSRKSLKTKVSNGGILNVDDAINDVINQNVIRKINDV